MPNCSLGAENLAEAFLTCEKLKQWTEKGSTKDILKKNVSHLEGSVKYGFEELGHPPFENLTHDIINLKNQADSEQPSPYFIETYADDIQRQILSEGMIGLIDCHIKKK